MKRTTLVLAATFAAVLLSAGCASEPVRPTSAIREASASDGPFRTETIDGVGGVMLEGHDATAYFTRGEAVRGSTRHSLQHKGVTWLFASADAKALFERDPSRYMPQFGGYCANGINYAIPWGGGGGPNTWRIYRGKLYVFGGQRSRDDFEMDTQRNLELAHYYWNSELAGSHAVIKRYQRLVMRVPHYKSGAALKSEWEGKRAAGTLPVMPGQPQVVPATH